MKIIPGHGPLSDVEGLKAFHRMLVETTDIVRKRMAAGKTLDQIKAEGLPEEWKSWGSGFIKTDLWLTLVYNSLSAKHLSRIEVTIKRFAVAVQFRFSICDSSIANW